MLNLIVVVLLPVEQTFKVDVIELENKGLKNDELFDQAGNDTIHGGDYLDGGDDDILYGYVTASYSDITFETIVLCIISIYDSL